jgi:hypothetical protein
MDKFKLQRALKAGKDVEQQELSLLVGMKNGTVIFRKTVWQLLTKPNILLPHDPTSGIFGIYSKIYVHTKIHTQIFIAIFS